MWKFPKQVLKKDLKALIVDKLVDMELIERPELVDMPSGGALGNGSVAEDEKPGGDPRVLQQVGGVGEQPQQAVMQPPPDPTEVESITSAGSTSSARLKVRLARLQMEAEDKAMARQMQHQLELKKPEMDQQTDQRTDPLIEMRGRI